MAPLRFSIKLQIASQHNSEAGSRKIDLREMLCRVFVNIREIKVQSPKIITNVTQSKQKQSKN